MIFGRREYVYFEVAWHTCEGSCAGPEAGPLCAVRAIERGATRRSDVFGRGVRGEISADARRVSVYICNCTINRGRSTLFYESLFLG